MHPLATSALGSLAAAIALWQGGNVWAYITDAKTRGDLERVRALVVHLCWWIVFGAVGLFVAAQPYVTGAL